MNIENCKKLGIIDINVYKELENKYKEAFEKYLLSKVNLAKYQEEMEKSDLDFGLLKNKPLLKSMLKEYLNLGYFFVLNNFHIEKLSTEQIEILKNGTMEDIVKLVETTYKGVIKNNYLDGKYVEEPYEINYIISTSDIGYAPNNALVFAIYYGSNTKKHGGIDGYLNNYKEKRNFLELMCDRIKDEVKKELDLTCKIIYEKRS